MLASKFKPYPEYKPSGELLGQIPSDWDIVPLKRDFEVQLGKMLQNEQKNETDTFEYYLKSANIQWNGVSTHNVNKMWFSQKEKLKFLLKKGDLLISEGGDVGRSCIFDDEIDECYIQNAVNRVRSISDTSTRYLYYWMKTMHNAGIIEIICNKSTIPHFTAEKVAEVRYFSPMVKEKDAIVDLLDTKCFEIQSTINGLQKSMRKLEEERSALITQAVTKGLNPDVSMKDSGIDWIGEIPEHWNTRKVKHLFQLMNEPSIPSHGMELLSVYTAIGVRPRKSLEQKGNKATSTDGYWLVQKEDLVVNKLLAWMGAIGRSEYDGVTSPAYDILRPLKDTVTEYFHFLFRCGICQPEFKKRSRGIMEMRLRLYFEELGSIEVPCPPPKEQQDIADYIRNLDDTQIDLETKLNKQIEMLTEYRTALISAAVTGKIDVRGL